MLGNTDPEHAGEFVAGEADLSRYAHLPFSSPRMDAAAPQVFVERPLWQMVAILYGSITLIALIVVALAFFVPLLVVGHAY